MVIEKWPSGKDQIQSTGRKTRSKDEAEGVAVKFFKDLGNSSSPAIGFLRSQLVVSLIVSVDRGREGLLLKGFVGVAFLI